jgi:hypothetical protein
MEGLSERRGGNPYNAFERPRNLNEKSVISNKVKMFHKTLGRRSGRKKNRPSP